MSPENPLRETNPNQLHLFAYPKVTEIVRHLRLVPQPTSYDDFIPNNVIPLFIAETPPEVA